MSTSDPESKMALPRPPENRRSFGIPGPCMTLPKIEMADLHEILPFKKYLLFCHTDSGDEHDRHMAELFLLPWRIYKGKSIQIHKANSQVELEDFPDFWFNTVLFMDFDTSQYQCRDGLFLERKSVSG